jgi:hypothetical protein
MKRDEARERRVLCVAIELACEKLRRHDSTHPLLRFSVLFIGPLPHEARRHTKAFVKAFKPPLAFDLSDVLVEYLAALEDALEEISETIHLTSSGAARVVALTA